MNGRAELPAFTDQNDQHAKYELGLQELPAFTDQNAKYELGLQVKLDELTANVANVKVSHALLGCCALFSAPTMAKDKIQLRKAAIAITNNLSGLAAQGVGKEELLQRLPNSIVKKLQDAVKMK